MGSPIAPLCGTCDKPLIVLETGLSAEGKIGGNMGACIIGEPLGGLTNRLLALTSLMRIADVFGREFQICWQPSPDCNVYFGDLFENDILAARRSDLRTDVRSIHIGFGANGWNVDPILEFPVDERDIWITTHGVITHANEQRDMPVFAPDSPVVFELWRYFRVFRVRKEISERVSAMNLERRKTLGLHIRRPLSANSAVSAAAQQNENTAFRMISDDYYASIIETVLRRDPSIVVLLCTNSSETELSFRGRFGDKIITLEKPTIDDTLAKESVVDAMIEMLLLSETFGVVRQDRSNFAWFSSLLGLAPNLIVRVLSPPAGPPDFVLARYQDNSRVQFTQGADALARLVDPKYNKLRY